MRVIILIKASEESEAGVMPSADLIEAMGAYNKELFEAGIMKGGDGLRPSSDGKRVLFDGTTREVVDGPFPSDELVAGFWLWEVEDMEEAVAWLKRSPNPMPGPGQVEIRPLYEAADFAEVMTADQETQEQQMREELESN